jgi:hypothetical protein
VSRFDESDDYQLDGRLVERPRWGESASDRDKRFHERHVHLGRPVMWLGRKRDDLCRTCHPECEVSSTVAEDAVRLMSGASGRDSGQ